MIHKSALLIHPDDTAAIVLEEVKKGETIMVSRENRPITITALDPIPVYHKIAFQNVGKGEKVKKYGEQIGVASVAIQKGEHIHEHNLVSVRDNCLGEQ